MMEKHCLAKIRSTCPNVYSKSSEDFLQQFRNNLSVFIDSKLLK